MTSHVLALKAPPPYVAHLFCLYFKVQIKPHGNTSHQREQESACAWKVRHPTFGDQHCCHHVEFSSCHGFQSCHGRSPVPAVNANKVPVTLILLHLLLAESLASFLHHLQCFLKTALCLFQGKVQPIICCCK